MFKADFQNHCIAKYPEEVCGCVCNGKYFPLKNKDTNKNDNFTVDYESLELIENQEQAEIEFLLHSHTNGSIAASEDDIRTQISLGIPLGLCSVQYDKYKNTYSFSEIYYVGKKNQQLIGRPYIWGIYDCYTLVIDTMRELYGIELPNIPRQFGWEKDKNYFEDNFAKLGFSEIPINDVRAGDCFLMTFSGHSRKATHCGVYVGDDMIIHHSSGKRPVDFSRLSTKEPVATWLPNITKWLRYNA